MTNGCFYVTPEIPPYEGAGFATKQMGGKAATAKRDIGGLKMLRFPTENFGNDSLASLIYIRVHPCPSVVIFTLLQISYKTKPSSAERKAKKGII